MNLLPLVALAAGAYAVCSVPIHRFFWLSDFDAPDQRLCRLRSVARVFLNILKGYLVVELGGSLGVEGALIALYFACLGHNYPFWSSFRGGTGLGTVFGGSLAIDPMLGLFALAAWTFSYYSFLNRTAAAMGSALLTPIAAGFLPLPFSPALLLPVTALVVWRHRGVLIDLHVDGAVDTEDQFRQL